MNNRMMAAVSRFTREAALVAALCGIGLGCADDDRRPSRDPGGGATETNVAPAPCSSDDECPEGIDCLTLDGGEVGFCDVNEMTVDTADGAVVTSNPLPAQCARPSDCPTGIECIFPNGPGSTGFCDVVEMVAP
jgi:hypothetical protein